MQSSLQYSANSYADAIAKSLAMKTIGQQAQDYRLFRKWNSARMAAAVGTSRQNIETLEKVGTRTPHYISDLARVMETTVDLLLKGDYVTPKAPVISGALSFGQPQSQAPPWPFNQNIVSSARYEALPPEIQVIVQGALRKAIEDEEDRLTKQDAPYKAASKTR